MWGLRRWPLLAAISLALLAAISLTLLAAASARAASRPTGDEPVLVSGSLTYTWQGDPARGCALEGLCDVVGSVIFDPDQGGGDVSFFGGRTSEADLSGTTTVRVRRGTVGFGGADCTDLDLDVDQSLELPITAHGLAAIDDPLSGGRCAGPLARELGAVRLRSAVSGGRLRTYDLRMRRSFVAGPFSGELVSTLVLRPDTAGGGSSSTGSGAPPLPRPTKKLVEYVDLRYRVNSLPSTLAMTFHGAPEPLCAVVDSCSVTGLLAVSIPRYRDTLSITELRMVRHRVGPRRALADLAAGRLGLFNSQLRSGAGNVRVQIAETISGGAVGSCRDAVVSRGPFVSFDEFGPSPGGPELPVALTMGFGSPTDVLRTHCEGPTTDDMVPSVQLTGTLASGTVSDRELLDRSVVVSLANPGGFSGPWYSGSRLGAITLSLSRLSVRAGTEKRALG